MTTELSIRQESRIAEAVNAGIPEARIAELVGCTVPQVRETITAWRAIDADENAWRAVLEQEKAKLKGD